MAAQVSSAAQRVLVKMGIPVHIIRRGRLAVGTRNPNPETWNLKPYTLNPESEPLNSELSTLTSNPKP